MFADKDVGKETLANSNFLNRHFHMIGVESTSKDVEFCGKNIRLQFWIISDDIEWFQHIWKQYIKGSQGVILMYDITNVKTLIMVSEWCQMVKDSRKDIPILLVGNKIDLEEQREVSKDQVDKFKEKHDTSSLIEISLKTGENVEKMFLNLTCMILKIDPKEALGKMLEEKRDHFVWIIDRAIKTKERKLEGKRKLKKLQKLWRKKYFEGTETFEEYLDKQKEIVLNLTDYKNEIMNAKELPEMSKVWEKIKNLL